MNCLLCSFETSVYASAAFKCTQCELVFKNPAQYLNTEEDFKRYSSHQNHSTDPGYLKFLNKVAGPLSAFLPSSFTSLDYGCGPGPTLSLLLREKGGEVHNYDPLFFADKNLLGQQYDVVTSTEVVEHFKEPKTDWDQLIHLIKPRGLLAVMTQFLVEDVDYQTWWYKNDPTHVAFYNENTFEFLAKKYGLEILFNDHVSVIIFRKK